MASTSLDIPEHYIRSFEKNWNHVVQQEVSKLRGRYMVKEFEGKECVMTDLDSVSFQERSSRLTNSTPTEATAQKRKLVKRDFKCQIIFDRLDDDFLGQLGRPDSEIIEAMRMAWNRVVDEEMLDAATENALGGEEPYTTTIAHDTTNQRVAVNHVWPGNSAHNTGLTPAKIQEAIRIFETNEIFPDKEEIFIAIGPNEKRDLIQYVETSSNDVWAAMIKAFLEGKDQSLMGLTPVLTNDLNTTGSDVYQAVCWSKRKGLCAAPDSMQIRIDERVDKDHAIQISAYGIFGATRRYEEGVVDILCDRSP